MSFTDDIENIALDLAEFAGYEAVLTRAAGGDPVDCHIDVIKAPEFIPDGFSALVTARQIVLDFCLVEIETATVRGDSVTIAAGVFAGIYTVESEMENDGFFQKVIVK